VLNFLPIVIMVRVARFIDDATGKPSMGVVQSDGKTLHHLEGDLFAGTAKDSGRPAKARGSTLLPPIEHVPSIICIGLNYKKHADELKLAYPKNPVLFMKPPTCLAGHGDPVVHPRCVTKFDYEVELAIVIGKKCKDITLEEAFDYILGYTVANDLSAREWQKEPELCGGQWTRGKIFDGFCPLGPCLVTKDEIPDPNKLHVQCFVNGEKRQDSNTSDMIFNVQQIVSSLSNSQTLMPGTVIITGTPFGVAEGMKPQAWLKPGDKVIVEVEGIGRLENTIVEDKATTKTFLNPWQSKL
jgi:2-keto-4-pentenoate hydratase/2-oxohepta-3-ene-1,7-dioic acid hydratase in catechol pathway